MKKDVEKAWNRLLTWLWFGKDKDSSRVVKAFDWTEFLVDNKWGQRSHTWIMAPELWLFVRFTGIEVSLEALDALSDETL